MGETPYLKPIVLSGMRGTSLCLEGKGRLAKSCFRYDHTESFGRAFAMLFFSEYV